MGQKRLNSHWRSFKVTSKTIKGETRNRLVQNPRKKRVSEIKVVNDVKVTERSN